MYLFTIPKDHIKRKGILAIGKLLNFLNKNKNASYKSPDTSLNTESMYVFNYFVSCFVFFRNSLAKQANK